MTKLNLLCSYNKKRNKIVTTTSQTSMCQQKLLSTYISLVAEEFQGLTVFCCSTQHPDGELTRLAQEQLLSVRYGSAEDCVIG